MTSTTTRRATPQQVRPSRREREGGPRAGVRTVAPQVAEPRRARFWAPEQAQQTERLPVVPRQRAAPPAPTTPRPPRPSVGSGVGRGIGEAGPGHRVDGRTRFPRNGLGLAALCLGLVALPLGLLPITAFLAAGLGVLALTYGVAGWSRTRAGVATNTGSAITGAVLGLLALMIGVAGTIAFFQDPTQPVYDLDALTTSVSTSTIGE